MADYTGIRDALVAVDSDRLEDLVREALAQGLPAREVLNQGLIAAMDIVGERMENGDMFIPEVLMCARAMSGALEILHPHLAVDGGRAAGRIVIGTVKGDQHDIGKNLVAMMVRSGGFEVIDLGVNVPPEEFVKAVGEHQPDILALSALLTTTMPMIRETILCLTENGRRSQVSIIVGGAPVTREYADQVGADGYASDAGAAVKLVKKLTLETAAA